MSNNDKNIIIGRDKSAFIIDDIYNEVYDNYITCNYDNTFYKLIETKFLDNVDFIFINGTKIDYSYLFYNKSKNSLNVKYNLFNDCNQLPSFIFSNCISLTSAFFPENINYIANEAFFGCSSLVRVNLDNITSIGSNAFNGACNLDLNIENIEDLYDYSLSGTGIKNPNIHEDIDRIYPGLFKDCYKLRVFNNPDKEFYLGEEAFSGCSSLERINIDYLGVSNSKIKSNSTDLYIETYDLNDEGVEANTEDTLPRSVFNGCVNLRQISFLDQITKFESCALMNCASLITEDDIVIKYADDFSFKNCKNIQSISFDENFEFLGNYVFDGCQSLTTVNNLNVISDIDSIGVFKNCISLDNLTDATFVNIPKEMFCNCKSLSTFNFSNTETINEKAFSNCVSLKNIDLSNVTEIKDNAFYKCSEIESLTLTNIESLGKYAFANCKNLKEVEIGESCQNIPEYCFANDTNLQKLVINSYDDSDLDLSTILMNCKKLSHIEIKNSERYSTPNNNCVFDKQTNTIIYVCKNISLFEISSVFGSEIISIDEHAFDNCKCNIIYIKDVALPTITSNIFKNMAFSQYHVIININDPKYKDYLRYVGNSHIYTYVNDIIVDDSSDDEDNSDSNNDNDPTPKPKPEPEPEPQPEPEPEPEPEPNYDYTNYDFGVDGIAYNILDLDLENKTGNVALARYLKNDDEYIIPKTVTYNNVTFNVTDIDSNAFAGCRDLTSVTIPNSVTRILVYAFCGCTGLTNIIIPNSVTVINAWAFQNCSSLISITIPDSVTYINHYAFNKCKGLTSVIIYSNTLQDFIHDIQPNKLLTVYVLPELISQYEEEYTEEIFLGKVQIKDINEYSDQTL